MSPHNKRGKQKLENNKTRRANLFGGRSKHNSYRNHQHHHHHNARSSEPSYLSAHTDRRLNRTQRDISSLDPFDRQLFDYIIVVDVEATCEKDHKHYLHEVIELPAVLIDVRRGLVDRKRSFHTYVKPWRNPKLTDFCTALTGITQAMVDGAPTITEAIKLFEAWYRETIPRGAKAIFASDGPWDFKNFIYEHHVLRDHVGFPTLFYEYLDVRTTFARVFNHGSPIKLEEMLSRMRLRFDGRPHCGFDDAYNIARLAVAMIKAGCVFEFLLAIPLQEDTYHYDLEGYPLYRRAEGSGVVDRDMVDDIAKRCFGADFFEFGERHKAAVAAYRLEHPAQFRQGTALALQRRTAQAAAERRRLWLLWCLSALVMLVVALVIYIGWLKLLR